MTTFKRGDFVMSEDNISIGIVDIGNDGCLFDCEDNCSVFWADGDHTTTENYESMFHYQLKPENWTLALIRVYVDKICPRQDDDDAIEYSITPKNGGVQ